MKRVQIIAMATCLMLILAACGGGGTVSSSTAPEPPASSQASSDTPPASEASEAAGFEFETTVLRFGTTSPETSLVVDTMRDFAERVSSAAGGKVTVEIFPASILGDVREMAQQAQLGVLDMCLTQPANLAEMGVDNMTVLVLPYLFTDYDQRWNVLTGEIGQELFDEVTNAGIKLRGFGYFLDGARNFFTAEGKPIRTVEDMKGMKIRVQDYALDNDMVVALGSSPTPTASSEMYAALQSGIVDGADQPIANYCGSRFYEVSSYFTLDEHYYNTPIVLFSEINWNRMPPELHAILTESWEGARDDSREKIIAAETELLDSLSEHNVEVIRLTDREKWVEAMAPVYEIHAQDKTDLIERIRAVK